ncbi:unnamed protein product [Closterium sp. Yama58-4]|nr:unnamed protein product [Closterium sp. Yama58-4]
MTGGSGERGGGEAADMGQGAMVLVAVKQLREESKQGEEEFLKEVLVLGRLAHAHLVQLFGYCVDGGAFLVYELMEGGSLDYALIDSKHLSTPLNPVKPLESGVSEGGAGAGAAGQRAPGAALGLAQATQGGSGGGGGRGTRIHASLQLHPSGHHAANVLLKPDYSAKLTDFGMVRVGPGGQLRSIVSTRIMGTEGYIDPTYLETGRFFCLHVINGGQLWSIGSTRIMGTEGYIDPSHLETGRFLCSQQGSTAVNKGQLQSTGVNWSQE